MLCLRLKFEVVLNVLIRSEGLMKSSQWLFELRNKRFFYEMVIEEVNGDIPLDRKQMKIFK
jgi:hypothetical protein